MKSIEVYRTKNNYKILTMYRLESWSYISSKPIFILSLDVNIEEFTNRFFEALNSSRELLESEEDKYWLGNQLLKEVKESSFNKFYELSTSCRVSIEEDLVVVAPRKYVGKNKGLFTDENNALKLSYNGENQVEIVAEVLKLLEG